MRPDLTVFIPAYNEAASLANSVQAVLAKLEAMGVPAEVIVVDDASHDASGAIADQLAAGDPRVRALHHPANRGIGGGFITAREHARGEWLILIPADLALDIDELPRYLAAAPEADVVVGLRSDRRDYTWARHLVSRTNILMIQLLFGMQLRQFQYISLYRMQVLQAITIDYWHSAFFLPEILIKARDLGFRLVEVEIRYAPRLTGKPTGAKLRLIVRTVGDMFHFWLRWKFLAH